MARMDQQYLIIFTSVTLRKLKSINWHQSQLIFHLAEYLCTAMLANTIQAGTLSKNHTVNTIICDVNEGKPIDALPQNHALNPTTQTYISHVWECPSPLGCFLQRAQICLGERHLNDDRQTPLLFSNMHSKDRDFNFHPEH